ncbi:MAG: phosphate acyltransferase, partial [Planctomycetota bacterium]|nr:phosphate acyltransferase [Planctomycetota bacterium]
MDILLELHEKARRLDRRIVLPESPDPRVRQAAARLASEGLCR